MALAVMPAVDSSSVFAAALEALGGDETAGRAQRKGLKKLRTTGKLIANHPANLVLRFLLEMAGLFALGYWGWTQYSGLWCIIWTAGPPLIAAVL